jgi:ArsR family transcriptional regulator, arsenate/arsenite/antimonite-responsive transcriptional repressor / arsenate reductase (thioredoxin)
LSKWKAGERLVDVTERARFHAALGDPSRLALVDLLIVNDLSPGDLARRLELPTNLLAHHLRVLEEAGIVRRTRSEGDGRRSYVRLRVDHPMLRSLDLAPQLGPELWGRRRVVFVCTHNSARSQLAVSAWRQVSGLPAESAGTRPSSRVHPGAARVAKLHGVPLDDTQTRHIADVVNPEDLVVAVCDQVHEELPEGHRLHWSVPDPVRNARAADFEAAYNDIVRRVGQLATAVEPPV